MEHPKEWKDPEFVHELLKAKFIFPSGLGNTKKTTIPPTRLSAVH